MYYLAYPETSKSYKTTPYYSKSEIPLIADLINLSNQTDIDYFLVACSIRTSLGGNGECKIFSTYSYEFEDIRFRSTKASISLRSLRSSLLGNPKHDIHMVSIKDENKIRFISIFRSTFSRCKVSIMDLELEDKDIIIKFSKATPPLWNIQNSFN